MFHNYIRFAVSEERDKLDLGKVAHFLRKESKMMIDSSVISFNANELLRKPDCYSSKKSRQNKSIFMVSKHTNSA